MKNTILNLIKKYFPKQNNDIFKMEYVETKVFINENKENLSFYNNIFSKNNFLNEEKANILKKIYEDSNTVNEILKPLNELNIKYSLSLVGGSVRDFLLNKHNEIKDLDFLICLQNPMNNDLSDNALMRAGFDDDDIKKINLDHSKDNMGMRIVNLLYKKYFGDFPNKKSNHQNMPMQTLDKNAYSPLIKKILSGVIREESDKFNYPVELLVTSNNKIAFFQSIDFNICVVGMYIVDNLGELKFPSFEKFPMRTYCSYEFLKDAFKKEITFVLHNKTIEQIDYSFNVHLKRMGDKFKDYSLKLYTIGSSEKIVEYADKLLFKYQLDSKLQKNDIVRKKLKI